MSVKPVDVEPEVTLVRWGVMQQNHSGFRLVGIHAGTGRGRVTSPIVAFEGLTLTVETESGRIYRLEGASDPDVAASLIHMHLKRSGLTVRDVALADVAEVAMSFAPKPGGWH